VIEGGKEKSSQLCEMSVVEHVEFYISSGLDKKDAIKKVASERKVAKSLVYAEYEKKLEDEKAGD
jgi:16S rRNA (cytidine1402-2'-O)-methyltransferase